jgi:hypothetical protein
MHYLVELSYMMHIECKQMKLIEENISMIMMKNKFKMSQIFNLDY